MNINRTLLTAWALAAIALAPLPALADMHGHGAMKHEAKPGYAALSPEKQARYDAVVRTFQPRLEELRDHIWAKKTELSALSYNSNTDPEILSRLGAELMELRVQMRDVHREMDAKLQQEVGVSPGYGNRRGCNF